MDKPEIYNPDGKENGLPLNIPASVAWGDMRNRLDEEMPFTDAHMPLFKIYADGKMAYCMAYLLMLLTAAGILWQANGDGGKNRVVANGTVPQNTNTSGKPNTAATKNGVQESPLPNKTAQKEPKAQVVKKGRVAGNNFWGNQTGTKALFDKNTHVGRIDTTPKANNCAVLEPNAENGKTTAGTTKYSPKPFVTKPLAAAKKDSTNGDSQTEEKEDKAIVTQAGFEWNAQMPITGQQGYFRGQRATAQPYLLLLPAAWLSLQADKYLFLAELNPFTTTVFNPKPFNETSKQIGTQTNLTQTRKLNKMFGFSTALRYNYNVVGHWWAGAGLQLNFWHNGIETNENTLDSGGIKTNYKSLGSLSDSDWAFFSKFQLRTDVELMYKTPKWNSGLRLGVFVTPIALNDGGPKNPLQVELFLRWKLFTIKKGQKNQ